jgi:protein-L-isoaspartate(D-aspartate) O-methyltransferase
MAALDPQPGEDVVQIGAGTGYYTSLLAALVQPRGEVHAYEIESDLAAMARRNLAELPCVTVHPTTGVGASLPAADIVYVNASAPAPDPAWLRALKPDGRMIFPWQPTRNGGVALHVTRRPAGFKAVAIMEVAFIPCVGAMTRSKPTGHTGLDEVARTRSIWLTDEQRPDETATAIYETVWFSSREA